MGFWQTMDLPKKKRKKKIRSPYSESLTRFTINKQELVIRRIISVRAREHQKSKISAKSILNSWAKTENAVPKRWWRFYRKSNHLILLRHWLSCFAALNTLLFPFLSRFRFRATAESLLAELSWLVPRPGKIWQEKPREILDQIFGEQWWSLSLDCAYMYRNEQQSRDISSHQLLFHVRWAL